ncbi:hypothetical protein V5799_014502 [Amblyomma americanum]|uniref:adenylate cyclase n=1 Tax=Amblyomma americanum TaxID=6943 RepID=A0AAQ4E2U7_AMBAM
MAGRKLSFKNVSNVVVQLLHSIKYSIDVPFANMAMPGPSGTAEKQPSKKLSCMADCHEEAAAANGTLPAVPRGAEWPHRVCPLPQYLVVCCLLTLLPASAFLRLPLLVKVLLLCPMAIAFLALVEISHAQVFHCYDLSAHTLVPLHVLAVVGIIHMLMAVLIHGRQVEWTARLDFLWSLQANEEKQEMHDLESSNRRILFNLLPAHVATHFLDNQLRNNMELYHQSYSRVGVMFASIPNFHEFYMELDGNNQGVECLRLLNEIIAEFDQVMQFSGYSYRSMGDYDVSPGIIGSGLPQVGYSPSHNIGQPHDGKLAFSRMLPEAAVPSTRQEAEHAAYLTNSSGSRKRTHEEAVSSSVAPPSVDSPEQVPRKQVCNSSPALQRLVRDQVKARAPLLTMRHEAVEVPLAVYRENGNCSAIAQPGYTVSDLLNGNPPRVLMRLGEESPGVALRLADAGEAFGSVGPLVGGPLLHLDSRSSWSNDGSSEADEEGAPLMDNHGGGYTTDDASLANDQGLTDAEGALSDLNSLLNDAGHEGDDTSISSRASSRLLSIDSLSVTYDSEYDNYGVGFNGAMGRTEDLRSLTDCITRNFGHCVSDNEDSDVLA